MSQSKLSFLCSGLTKFSILAVAAAAFGTSAQAADLTWGGIYRFEAHRITNSEMTGDNSNKAYALHHMVLMPKAVIADGLTIFSRLDVLNSNSFGIAQDGTVTSVAGDVLGAGPGAGFGTSAPYASNGTTGTNSNALAQNQRAAMVNVTALYASWVQEFGQFVVGRSPLHFGLGTHWNAGNGLFDHYLTTRDLVAYKIILGNLSFMPILGKVNEGNLGEEDDVNEYTMQFGYENPDTELAIGVLYSIRVGTFAGNDTPTTSAGGLPRIGDSGTVRADGFKHSLIGLYSTQKLGNFRVGVEADILTGDTGLRTSTGLGVNFNSYSVAGEIKYERNDSPISGMMRLGLVTGDDPGTVDTYEGFHVHRNYDIAMLMFNHPLGQRDFFRTSLVRDVTTRASNQIDTEAMSNALYFAPGFQIRRSDKFSWGAKLVYAMLNKDPIGSNTGVGNSLGFETDVNLTYKPYERMTWVTELGALFPGDAWKAGNLNLQNNFMYGISTKAAINF